jgi:site-specific recombinase XerD
VRHTKEEKQTVMLRTLFQQYREYQTDLKKLAASTRESYFNRIGRFLAYCGENATVSDLTRPKVAHYAAMISARTPVSTRLHVASISNFCRWLIGEGWLRKNPAEDIDLPKVKDKRREPVPDDTIEILFDACNRLPATPYKRALTRAVLAAITYGGMRRCEVIECRVGDIDIETGRVYIAFGKGGKSREVYLCDEGVEAIRDYLEVRPDCQHEYLFAWSYRDRVSEKGYASLIKRVHTVAGMEKRYTGHQFRHSVATRLDQNGAALTDIQAFLGHSRADTTSRYLHKSAERVKAIAPLTKLSKKKTEPKPAEKPKTAPSPSGEKREDRKRFNVRRL